VKTKDFLTNELASPPVVYHKLKDAMRDPESTFQDFADIILSDPGLSIRILRIVNSSFYGLSAYVDSVTHTLNILGVDQLGCMSSKGSVRK
jgi:HD-like signal output (HDOD) protein